MKHGVNSDLCFFNLLQNKNVPIKSFKKLFHIFFYFLAGLK